MPQETQNEKRARRRGRKNKAGDKKAAEAKEGHLVDNFSELEQGWGAPECKERRCRRKRKKAEKNCARNADWRRQGFSGVLGLVHGVRADLLPAGEREEIGGGRSCASGVGAFRRKETENMLFKHLTCGRDNRVYQRGIARKGNQGRCPTKNKKKTNEHHGGRKRITQQRGGKERGDLAIGAAGRSG